MDTLRGAGRHAWLALADLAGDVRLAVRSLSKARSFTIVAVLSLALGIGVNTALLAFVDATMFRPVPGVTGADRIVEVLLTRAGGDIQEWAYPDFQDVRAEETPLDVLAGWKMRRGTLGTGESAQTVRVMYVSAGYFDLLGVRLARGRNFVPSEDVGPGQHPVAIVSHALWRDRLGGGADVVGGAVTLNRTPYTVIGVAPESFRGHRSLEPPPDLWVPVVQIPFLSGQQSYQDDRDALWLNVLGRLREDAGADQATAALRTIFGRLAQLHPASNRDRGARAVLFGPVPALNRDGNMAAAAALLALAGLVLLVICGNIAGMTLARGVSRVREMAVRMALGASSGRLVRQLMADALVLAGTGGGIGVLLAYWATSITASTAFVGFPDSRSPPELDGAAWLRWAGARRGACRGPVAGVPVQPSRGAGVGDARPGQRGAPRRAAAPDRRLGPDGARADVPRHVRALRSRARPDGRKGPRVRAAQPAHRGSRSLHAGLQHR